MVKSVLFNYAKDKFSPVQFLDSWPFAISSLFAIANPLFFVISEGSFSNPDKYWTSAMSAVKKLSVVILRKAAMSAGQRRKVCPFRVSLGSPSAMRMRRIRCHKCFRGSQTWSTGFLIAKKPSDVFFVLSLLRAKGTSWLFSKLETSFLKSGLIASSSPFCLALCVPSFRTGPALLCPNEHSKMSSGIQAWIITVKMNRREWLAWNLQTEAGNQAPILMRLCFWDGLWNHSCCRLTPNSR